LPVSYSALARYTLITRPLPLFIYLTPLKHRARTRYRIKAKINDLLSVEVLSKWFVMKQFYYQVSRPFVRRLWRILYLSFTTKLGSHDSCHFDHGRLSRVTLVGRNLLPSLNLDVSSFVCDLLTVRVLY